MRRLPVALALLGCIVHAMVLPWYASSRIPAHMMAAALTADLAVICHGGAATTGDAAGLPAPVQPDPTSDCPICKALVGLQFAVLVAAQVGLLEQVAGIEQHWLPDAAPRNHVVFAPRNRGPPLFV